MFLKFTINVVIKVYCLPAITLCSTEKLVLLKIWFTITRLILLSLLIYILCCAWFLICFEFCNKFPIILRFSHIFLRIALLLFHYRANTKKLTSFERQLNFHKLFIRILTFFLLLVTIKNSNADSWLAWFYQTRFVICLLIKNFYLQEWLNVGYNGNSDIWAPFTQFVWVESRWVTLQNAPENHPLEESFHFKHLPIGNLLIIDNKF